MTDFMPLFKDLLNYSAISTTPDVKLMTLEEYDEFHHIFDLSMDLIGGLNLKDILTNEANIATIDENLDYLENFYNNLSSKQQGLQSVKNSKIAYNYIRSALSLYKLMEKLKFMTLVHTEFEFKLNKVEFNALKTEVVIKFDKTVYYVNGTFVMESDLLNHIILNYTVNSNDVNLLLKFIDKILGVKQVSKSKFADLLNDIENINLLKSTTDE